MNPFTNVNRFLTTVTNDVTTLALTVCIIGFIFCGLMVWNGSEENAPRFKKAMGYIGGAVVVIALAKIIVPWIRTGVA